MTRRVDDNLWSEPAREKVFILRNEIERQRREIGRQSQSIEVWKKAAMSHRMRANQNAIAAEKWEKAYWIARAEWQFVKTKFIQQQGVIGRLVELLKSLSHSIAGLRPFPIDVDGLLGEIGGVMEECDVTWDNTAIKRDDKNEVPA